MVISGVTRVQLPLGALGGAPLFLEGHVNTWIFCILKWGSTFSSKFWIGGHPGGGGDTQGDTDPSWGAPPIVMPLMVIQKQFTFHYLPSLPLDPQMLWILSGFLHRLLQEVKYESESKWIKVWTFATGHWQLGINRGSLSRLGGTFPFLFAYPP